MSVTCFQEGHVSAFDDNLHKELTRFIRGGGVLRVISNRSNVSIVYYVCKPSRLLRITII